MNSNFTIQVQRRAGFGEWWELDCAHNIDSKIRYDFLNNYLYLYLAIPQILLSGIICIWLSGKFYYPELSVSSYPAKFTIRASLPTIIDGLADLPLTDLLPFVVLPRIFPSFHVHFLCISVLFLTISDSTMFITKSSNVNKMLLNTYLEVIFASCCGFMKTTD